jgi:hypothetical protein
MDDYRSTLRPSIVVDIANLLLKERRETPIPMVSQN